MSNSYVVFISDIRPEHNRVGREAPRRLIASRPSDYALAFHVARSLTPERAWMLQASGDLRTMVMAVADFEIEPDDVLDAVQAANGFSEEDLVLTALQIQMQVKDEPLPTVTMVLDAVEDVLGE